MFKYSREVKLFMKVELEVPEEIEKEVRRLAKEIDWRYVMSAGLQRAIKEELEIALVKRILSKSKLTEKNALKLGEEIKEGIARRHGLL
jgi:hypothetical protein